MLKLVGTRRRFGGRAVAGRVFLLLAVVAGSLVAPAAASADEATCESHRGFIPVGGTGTPFETATGEFRSPAHLSYTVACPAASGPVPALVVYNAYSDDVDYVTVGHGVSGLTDAGYALIAVATRGVACSSGSFNPFHPDEARDGYDVIEWIASQPWSNGKIAMFGESAAAITQFPVAALQPPSLDAIVPAHPLTDFYRDVARPGGIPNVTEAPGWQAFATAQSAQAAAFGTPYLVMAGPPPTVNPAGVFHPEDSYGCPTLPDHYFEEVAPPHVLAQEFRDHEWDDEFFRERSSFDDLSKIEVPVHLGVTWQDEVVSSRAASILSQLKNSWGAFTNGDHGYNTSFLKKDELEFLAHFLKDEANGFEETHRVKVRWESGRSGAWESGYAAWPPPQSKVETLFLSDGDGEDGALSWFEPAGDPDSFLYDGVSGQSSRPYSTDLKHGAWDVTPVDGHSLVYTSPPLTKDLTVLGGASVDLWLGSTATDTDVQVTLSDVRDPAGGQSGTETFVQQGWLRASHRTEDELASTDLLPWQTHKELDSKDLVPGPNEMRIEILPFGHLFRAGSRIRLTIEAPYRAPTPNWSFDSIPGGATNTVFHDELYPSRLLLSTIPGKMTEMLEGPPACGQLRAQPCRTF